MALIDEVKRRAGQARFEAERALRANRVKSRLGALQNQFNAGATQLGRQVFVMAARGEFAQAPVQEVLDQLNAVQAQLAAAEQEIRSIQAESYVYELPGIRCAACGTENDQGARFCHGCGAVLAPQPPAWQPGTGSGGVVPPDGAGPALVCSTCGTPNPPGMRFCQHCGAALTQGAPGAAPAATVPPETSPAEASAPGTPEPAPSRSDVATAASIDAGAERDSAQAAATAQEPATEGAEATEDIPEAIEAAAIASAGVEQLLCTGCGAAMAPNARFCASCGLPVAQPGT